MFFPLILIVIGVIFLLKNLGFISGSAWDVIWPSLLIIWGLSMIFSSRQRREQYWWSWYWPRSSRRAHSPEEKQHPQQ
ncbi:MAG: LiaI-LiaF-like domain-containing protein [Bacteroidota bacterium]